MRQLRHGWCMWAIQRVTGQDKRFKCLWTGYGSRFQAHRFVSRTALLLGFSRSTVSHVYQEWSTTQRTSSQLDTTVGSIGVNMGQHPCGTLSTPCRVHAQMNWGDLRARSVPNVRYTQCKVHEKRNWFNFWTQVFEDSELAVSCWLCLWLKRMLSLSALQLWSKPASTWRVRRRTRNSKKPSGDINTMPPC